MQNPNRHCPKWQTLNKERWIEARKDDLLNVGYFHVVFTLPDLLNPVAYQNQQIVYDLLFKAAAETSRSYTVSPFPTSVRDTRGKQAADIAANF